MIPIHSAKAVKDVVISDLRALSVEDKDMVVPDQVEEKLCLGNHEF